MYYPYPWYSVPILPPIPPIPDYFLLYTPYYLLTITLYWWLYIETYRIFLDLVRKTFEALPRPSA
ncbi:MAG: hypothetical protein DRJ40_08880 [Thermoprotei archaeon]|nr:MAG: hypothetical protein DRJ40_08880 [Thermoprotei archaeon]